MFCWHCSREGLWNWMPGWNRQPQWELLSRLETVFPLFQRFEICVSVTITESRTSPYCPSAIFHAKMNCPVRLTANSLPSRRPLILIAHFSLKETNLPTKTIFRHPNRNREVNICLIQALIRRLNAVSPPNLKKREIYGSKFLTDQVAGGHDEMDESQNLTWKSKMQIWSVMEMK